MKFKSQWIYETAHSYGTEEHYDNVPDKAISWKNIVYWGRWVVSRQGVTEYGQQLFGA